MSDPSSILLIPFRHLIPVLQFSTKLETLNPIRQRPVSSERMGPGKYTFHALKTHVNLEISMGRARLGVIRPYRRLLGVSFCWDGRRSRGELEVNRVNLEVNKVNSEVNKVNLPRGVSIQDAEGTRRIVTSPVLSAMLARQVLRKKTGTLSILAKRHSDMLVRPCTSPLPILHS